MSEPSPTHRTVEIANFEGPDGYHSLKVVLMDDGTFNVVHQAAGSDHWNTILDGIGRWYSSAEHWEDLGFEDTHDGRKPICTCDDPDPETLGAGTPVEFQVCQNCSGVIEGGGPA